MRPTRAWGDPLATSVSCLFQPGDGRLKVEMEGKKVEVAGLVLVAPSAWPDGVAPARNDRVVITSGPAATTDFRVHGINLMGGAPWDDELVVVHDLEPAP